MPKLVCFGAHSFKVTTLLGERLGAPGQILRSLSEVLRTVRELLPVLSDLTLHRAVLPLQIGDLALQTGNLTLQCIAGRLLFRYCRSFRRALRNLLLVLSDLILQCAVLSL